MGNAGASSKHVDLSTLVAATNRALSRPPLAPAPASLAHVFSFSVKESELRDLLRQFRRAAGASSSSAFGVGVLSARQWRELCAAQCGLDDERLQARL